MEKKAGKKSSKKEAEVPSPRKTRSRRNDADAGAEIIKKQKLTAEKVAVTKRGTAKKPKQPDSKNEKAQSEPAKATSIVSQTYDKDVFTIKTKNGKPAYNFKISSWNVAGLRSWVKKDNMQIFNLSESDIICLQETKCSEDQLPKEVQDIAGYHRYWLCNPGGYAGVAIYSKIEPVKVDFGIGSPDFDKDGRIITAEYEKFYLINVYVPNSGRKLVNLDSRMVWEDLFLAYVQKLDALKPVIVCGDMNVSHLEIDLANPKTNTRNAGFTKEERDKMTRLLDHGFIDTFRHLYPERKDAYTFWTYMGNARKRNVGWRLDYFIVSERMKSSVVDNCIHSQCMGSDHCPITLFLKV